MRRWCRKLLGPSCDFLLFLRPRQWPILTVQLAVSMLLAPACVAAWRAGGAQPLEPAAWRSLLASWLAWVVCLNGGTLAYNSAYDRDVQDIAYLRAPPPPLPGLAPLALALMILGTALAFSVAFAFGAVTGSCLLLSVAYSHPACRWKGVAALDLRRRDDPCRDAGGPAPIGARRRHA
jgi:hypothetical protein